MKGATILAAFGTLPATMALQMVAPGQMTCDQELPVELKFSSLCSEESLYTFGEYEQVKGSCEFMTYWKENL